MSWLISLLIAGAVFSTENNLPFQANNNYSQTSAVNSSKADETERFEQTYPLNANGRVSVSNVNGSITVEGWDKNEVKLEYVKTADTKENLADVEVKIDAQKDSLNVETKYDSSWNRGSRKNKRVEVAFHLMVPRNALLDEIETVNGSVSISNTTNAVKVSAVNGEVKAFNLRGAAELSTVNGTVTADFERLENTNRISLETVNGQAFLTIPSDANATVRAETTNGKITNDFGLPVRKGQYVGHSLYGKIGDGNVKIKLESVNGELTLRRRQDGKNPNPVTNLLDTKSDDDLDGAVNESVREAMREAAKVKIPEMKVDMKAAMEQAQKEMAGAKIDSAQMQKAMQDAMRQQKAAMEKMREAGWFSGAPSVETKSESFAVKGVPKVSVYAKDSTVFVRGWDKPEVQYNITQISKNSSAMPIQYTVNHSDSEVSINLSENNLPPENDWDGGVRLRIEIFVPRKSNLQITTNREVRLENVSGELNVQGGAEAVDIRDADGNLNVSTDDGKVRVIGFRGAIAAKTTDGLMSLEGDFQKLSAHTNGGAIILTLPENADATIESNNENINAEGFALVRQVHENNTASTWKIGNGGKTYLLNTDNDGKIFVRNSNLLKIK